MTKKKRKCKYKLAELLLKSKLVLDAQAIYVLQLIPSVLHLLVLQSLYLLSISHFFGIIYVESFIWHISRLTEITPQPDLINIVAC